MAIAPTELGGVVFQHWSFDGSSDASLVQALREHQLVAESVADETLRGTFSRAREEHAALPPGIQEYNSPHERVRVFLEPYLTRKGRDWAVPFGRP